MWHLRYPFNIKDRRCNDKVITDVDRSARAKNTAANGIDIYRVGKVKGENNDYVII